MPRLGFHVLLFACIVLVGCGTKPAKDAQEIWSARYDGPAHAVDGALAIRASPMGGRVFVTGLSTGEDSGKDYATLAYDAATGRELWSARYNGPVDGEDEPHALAVSRDGTRVFVTGESPGLGFRSEFTTIAYEAATGREIWVARYGGTGAGEDVARGLGVSADGARVFVAGTSVDDATRADFATLAYDAATGAQLWVARHDTSGGADEVRDLVVAADRVVVAGFGPGGGGKDFLVAAYDAVTGNRSWLASWDGPSSGEDVGRRLAADPGGHRVYVVGTARDEGGTGAFATLAYGLDDGTLVWHALYEGDAPGADEAQAVAPAPAGDRVYVAGMSTGAGTQGDFAVVAYDATTGEPAWVSRYDGPDSGQDDARSLAVTSDGGRLLVTGLTLGGAAQAEFGSDLTTVGLDARTGDRTWVVRRPGPGYALALDLSSDGARVFVTGSTWFEGSRTDFVTVAYRVDAAGV